MRIRKSSSHYFITREEVLSSANMARGVAICGTVGEGRTLLIDHILDKTLSNGGSFVHFLHGYPNNREIAYLMHKHGREDDILISSFEDAATIDIRTLDKGTCLFILPSASENPYLSLSREDFKCRGEVVERVFKNVLSIGVANQHAKTKHVVLIDEIERFPGQSISRILAMNEERASSGIGLVMTADMLRHETFEHLFGDETNLPLVVLFRQRHRFLHPFIDHLSNHHRTSDDIPEILHGSCFVFEGHGKTPKLFDAFEGKPKMSFDKQEDAHLGDMSSEGNAGEVSIFSVDIPSHIVRRCMSIAITGKPKADLFGKLFPKKSDLQDVLHLLSTYRENPATPPFMMHFVKKHSRGLWYALHEIGTRRRHVESRPLLNMLDIKDY